MSNQPDEIRALFPTVSHKQLPQAIQFLLEQFNTTSLPAYLNQLPDLPTPQWNLFDDDIIDRQ